jgi:hypothetical protein
VNDYRVSDAYRETIRHLKEELHSLEHRRQELEYTIAALARRIGTAATTTKRSTKAPVAAKSKAKPRAKPATQSRPKLGQAPNTELAEWRRQVLAPVLAHPKGSPERTRALHELAASELTPPGGSPRRYSEASIYLWVQQAEGTVGNGRGAGA